MSRSGWRYIIAVVGLGATLAVGAYAQPIGDNRSDGSTPQQRSVERNKHAAPMLPEDVGAAIKRIAGAAEAIKDKVETTAERQRAERDLYAQERMAKWARLMFWATVASIVLSAAGVFLIWRTLFYTRDAVIAAKETVDQAEKSTIEQGEQFFAQLRVQKESIDVTRIISQRDQRAWITVNIPCCEIADTKSGVNLNVNIIIFNIGKIPARKIWFFAECIDIAGEGPKEKLIENQFGYFNEDYWKKYKKWTYMTKGPTNKKSHILPNSNIDPITINVIAKVVTSNDCIHIIYGVTYDDGVSKDRRISAEVACMFLSQDNGKTIYKKGFVLNNSEIAI